MTLARRWIDGTEKHARGLSGVVRGSANASIDRADPRATATARTIASREKQRRAGHCRALGGQ